MDGAVAPVDLVLALEAAAVPVERIVPAHATADLTGVGVEQELGGIEPVPVGRVPVAMHTVSVELAWEHTTQIAVPDILRAAGQADGLMLVALARIEQAEVNRRRVVREECEIDAAAIEMRTQGSGHAVVDADHFERYPRSK